MAFSVSELYLLLARRRCPTHGWQYVVACQQEVGKSMGMVALVVIIRTAAAAAAFENKQQLLLPLFRRLLFAVLLLLLFIHSSITPLFSLITVCNWLVGGPLVEVAIIIATAVAHDASNQKRKSLYL